MTIESPTSLSSATASSTNAGNENNISTNNTTNSSSNQLSPTAPQPPVAPIHRKVSTNNGTKPFPIRGSNFILNYDKLVVCEF